MKRIFLFLMALILSFDIGSVVALATAEPQAVGINGNSFTVSVDNVVGDCGEIVEVPVMISGNCGFSNLSIEIGYDDDVLVLVDVTENKGVGATFSKAQNISKNPYNMSWDCTSDNFFTGNLVMLTFKIISDVSVVTPITVDYYKGRYGNYKDGISVNYNGDFAPLSIIYCDGSVDVNACGEAGQYEASVSLADVSGCKGDIIEIPIILSECNGFSNLSVEIIYNKNILRLINITANASVGASFSRPENYDVVPYNMSWDSVGNIFYNGCMATLTFEIISDMPGIYPVTVDFYKGRNQNYKDGVNVNYDEEFNPLKLEYISCFVTVLDGSKPEITKIEAKSDGTVTVTLSGEDMQGMVYAVLTDVTGNKKIKSVPVSKIATFYFDSYDSKDNIKIMWWNSLLVPMCKSKEIQK